MEEHRSVATCSQSLRGCNRSYPRRLVPVEVACSLSRSWFSLGALPPQAVLVAGKRIGLLQTPG